MKILKSGTKKDGKLHGKCRDCGCEIECEQVETQTLMDRDTLPGMATRYVKCPECSHDYLWVR